MGVIFFPGSNSQCSQISGFTVHHTLEAGITFSSSASRVEVEDVVVADNLVGIAVLPATGDAGTAAVKDVVVIGNSVNGGCGYDLDIECRDRSAERETGVGSRTGGSGSPGSHPQFSGCGHRYEAKLLDLFIGLHYKSHEVSFMESSSWRK